MNRISGSLNAATIAADEQLEMFTKESECNQTHTLKEEWETVACPLSARMTRTNHDEEVHSIVIFHSAHME